MLKSRPMTNLNAEKQTVELMIAIYCRRHHGTRHELCAECSELRDYALERINRCVHGAGKPVCAKCAVHCYKPGMRERIRRVMRFAGPRMLLCHPLLTLRHLLAGLRG